MWTNEWPTEPGCYWFYGQFFRDRSEPVVELHFVRVYETANDRIVCVTDGCLLSQETGAGVWQPVSFPDPPPDPPTEPTDPTEKGPVYSFTEEDVASVLDDLGLVLSAGELEEVHEVVKAAFEAREREVVEDALVDYRDMLQRRWEQEHQRIA